MQMNWQETRFLKGHGFIRAAKCLFEGRPLGPEGGFLCHKTFPQGLKPAIFPSFVARINPCPFKN